MASIFLLIALCVELALMAFSLVTKSRQEKTGSIVRLFEFVVFAALVLAAVIEWSFRWYGLAALLFIQSARGLRTLLKTKAVEYKSNAIVFRAITTMWLVLVSVTPALIFPQYEPLLATGPYAVATTRFTYTDKSRIEQFTSSREYRRVDVVFWYPQNADGEDAYPLVVSSHGGLGTETSNESLYRELASHGYIVCSIGHPYHAFWTKEEDGGITFVSMEYFQEILQEDAKRDKQQSYRYYQKWMATRTGDINLVIDTVLKNTADGADGVYGLVDVERIGLMGHSLGGSAALGVPRQRNDIDAVIALESPFLYDIVGVENDEFVFTDQAYPVPVLNVYSDSAWEHLSDWAQYARNYALLSDPPMTAFSLHLPGAGHFSLTDLSLASPVLVRILEGREAGKDSETYLKAVNKACLGFFDAYLKNQDVLITYGLDDVRP